MSGENFFEFVEILLKRGVEKRVRRRGGCSRGNGRALLRIFIFESVGVGSNFNVVARVRVETAEHIARFGGPESDRLVDRLG